MLLLDIIEEQELDLHRFSNDPSIVRNMFEARMLNLFKELDIKVKKPNGREVKVITFKKEDEK